MERERNIDQLLLVYTLTREQTCKQSRALTRDGIGDFSLFGMMPNQQRHTSQG